ncbi:MAG: protease complex subunit PrcB family protein [Bryobacteraceae bacterium]
MKINFTSVDKGENSSSCWREEVLVRDGHRWKELWDRHTADEEPARPAPSLDFASEMVVAVFAGEKPTSGYSIEVNAVESNNDELVVSVSERKPGASAMDVVTCPFHIVRINRTEAKQLAIRRT